VFCFVNNMHIETVTEWYIRQGMGFCVLKSMLIETAALLDFRQGKGGFVLSTSCKFKLKQCGISERGMGVFCYQQHAN
jgi:hypothetical protein